MAERVGTRFVIQRPAWIVLALVLSETAALGGKLTDKVNQYSVTYPKGWIGRSFSSGLGRELELTNFPESKRPPQLGLPPGGAEISITMWPPWIDEYAALMERAEHDSIISSSRNPARVEFTDILAFHYVALAPRNNGKLFHVLLRYGIGDPRGQNYQRVLSRVVASISVAAATPVERPQPAVTVHVGSAQGAPGDEVTFAVRLETNRSDITFVGGLLRFDPHISLVIAANGRAACRCGDDVRNLVTECPECVRGSFVLSPGRLLCLRPTMLPACDKVEAMATYIGPMREAIPNQAVLYTCTVKIAPDTAPGGYAIVPTGLHVDTFGSTIEGAIATEGEVVVIPRAVQ